MSAAAGDRYYVPEVLDKKFKNISGLKFGRLTALDHLGRREGSPSRNHFWTAVCECGSVVEVNGGALRGGDTRSCGCLQREIATAAGDRTRTHGMSGTSTHSIWDTMVRRCTKPKAKDFHRYGAVGIGVCDRWLKFEDFLADMGERPPGMSIDRIDNSKGYSPDNCRWATNVEQQRNKSNNTIITHNGQSKCMAAWAEDLGMNPITLSARFGRGWSPAKALTTPVDMRRSTCGGSRK